MADTEKPNQHYDLRRDSRGVEPEHVRSPWRARLAWWGGTALFLALILSAWVIWRRVVTVHTLGCRVQAAVIQLSPEVDARLREVLVSETQSVTQGEVLARLDDTEIQASLAAVQALRSMRQSDHAQAQARERLAAARLQADIEAARAGVAMAQARLASIATELQSRQRRLPEEVRRAQAQHEREAAVQQRLEHGARPEEIEAAKARVASAQATLALCQIEVEQSRQLVQEGIDSQYIFEARKTRLETQRNTLRETELNLALLEAGATAEELAAARLLTEVRSAELAMARLGELDLADLRNQQQVREAELAEAEAVLRQVEARREELAISQQQTLAAQAELQRAEAELRSREAALRDHEIRSPVDGVVIRILAKVGESCRRSVPLILVADTAVPRWVEGYVTEADAMHVDVGQAARVRIPANSFHAITARVSAIGLHTQSLDLGGDAGAMGATRFGQPDRVWVKLTPEAPLEPLAVTGTSARALIRVR